MPGKRAHLCDDDGDGELHAMRRELSAMGILHADDIPEAAVAPMLRSAAAASAAAAAAAAAESDSDEPHRLPDDCWGVVLSFLPPAALLNVGIASQYLRVIASTHVNWAPGLLLHELKVTVAAATTLKPPRVMNAMPLSALGEQCARLERAGEAPGPDVQAAMAKRLAELPREMRFRWSPHWSLTARAVAERLDQLRRQDAAMEAKRKSITRKPQRTPEDAAALMDLLVMAASTTEALARAQQLEQLCTANAWLDLHAALGGWEHDTLPLPSEVAAILDHEWGARASEPGWRLEECEAMDADVERERLLCRWARIKCNEAAGMTCVASALAEVFPIERLRAALQGKKGAAAARYAVPKDAAAWGEFLSTLRCRSLDHDLPHERDVSGDCMLLDLKGPDYRAPATSGRPVQRLRFERGYARKKMPYGALDRYAGMLKVGGTWVVVNPGLAQQAQEQQAQRDAARARWN